MNVHEVRKLLGEIEAGVLRPHGLLKEEAFRASEPDGVGTRAEAMQRNAPGYISVHVLVVRRLCLKLDLRNSSSPENSIRLTY